MLGNMEDFPISLNDFTALTEDKGVWKKTIRPGKVDISPTENEEIFAKYDTKYYVEGKEVDGRTEELNRKYEINFHLGRDEVMEAFNIAVRTMKLGEICRLAVAPKYAYEDDRTLIVELELVDIRGTDVNLSNLDSVFLTRIERGNAGTPVRPGEICELTVKEYTREKFIGERHFPAYIAGDHACNDLPEGFDIGLTSMDAGEKGRLWIGKDVVYPKEWYEKHEVPIGSALYCYIHVVSCEQRKTPSVFKTFSDKLDNMNQWKEKANVLLKSGKCTIALAMYADLLNDIPSIVAKSFKETNELMDFKNTLHLNRAMAYILLKSPDECLKECDKSLELNEHCEKALYRKGEAYLLLNDHEEAQSWFEKALKVNPKNVAASSKVNFCKRVISEQLKKETRMFKSAFRQMAESKEDDVVLSRGDEGDSNKS